MKRTQTAVDAKPIVMWACSESCPAMSPIIASMRKLPMPHPAPFGMPGEGDLVLDGSNYELSAPSNDPSGSLILCSNTGSSLSRWIDDALARLNNCWSASPPN